MGKKTYGHFIPKDSKGNPLRDAETGKLLVVVSDETMSRGQKKSTSQLIPFTEGPGKNLLKRAARNLWG